MSTASKMAYLMATKTAIAQAISDKGVAVDDGDTFREYADKIGEISSGGSQTVTAECTISESSSATSTPTYYYYAIGSDGMMQLISDDYFISSTTSGGSSSGGSSSGGSSSSGSSSSGSSSSGSSSSTTTTTVYQGAVLAGGMILKKVYNMSTFTNDGYIAMIPNEEFDVDTLEWTQVFVAAW